MSDSHEHRKSPRIELILKVEYEKPGDFLSDYVCNASGEGVFIATTRNFVVGEQLVFNISFPGLLSPILCRGEVRWRRLPENATEDMPAGIGVEFVFQNEEESEKIKRLIEQLTKSIQTKNPDLPRAPFSVLVAEDNPLVREMLRFGLRKFQNRELNAKRKLKVIEAENGRIAWEQIQKGSIDLAIVDYYMPVMDGGQLTQLIRSDHNFRSLPIIVISVGGEEVRREAYNVGADLFLDKPVLLGKLFESLHRLMGLQQNLTE